MQVYINPFKQAFRAAQKNLKKKKCGSKNGTPVLLRDLGTVSFGPDIREGVAEWNGEGTPRGFRNSTGLATCRRFEVSMTQEPQWHGRIHKDDIIVRRCGREYPGFPHAFE